MDFMLYLETLIKEKAADPDLIEVQCCLEDNNNIRRLQTRDKEFNSPLRNNLGRRRHHHPEKPTLCRTKSTTFRPPKN